MAHVATGWTVIDEFCARFVYFYSGYLFATYVFALSDRARAQPGAGACRTGAVGARQRRPGDLGFSEWPLISLALGLRRRLRHHRDGHAAGADAVAELPALLRRAFHRHLSRLLPADGGDADAAAADRPDPRHRHDLADRHRRRRRRRAGDLAAGAGGAAPISCSSGPTRSGSRRKRPRRRCRRRSRLRSCSPG